MSKNKIIKAFVFVFILILASVVSLSLYKRIDREGDKVVHSVQPDNVSVVEPAKSDPAKIDLAKILYHDFETFETMNQRKINLQNLKTDLILLNFLAPWCGPCLQEFLDMIELVKSYNGKITLIAVPVYSNLEASKQVIHKLKFSINYPVQDIYWVWNKDKKFPEKHFGAGILQTFIIDRKRHIAGKFLGSPNWKSKEVFSKIESTLSKN